VGYVNNSLDCDDSSASINPNTVWYRDLDGDGRGFAPDGSLTQCAHPAGYALIGNDNCPSIANPNQADCNTNGIGDVCEIASGELPDCDHDNVPYTCEGATTVAASSKRMPFSGTLPAEHTFTALPRAYNGSAKITIEATADLGGATDGIIVTLDGGSASTFFVADGTDCPSTPNTATITVPMAQFNALVADGSLAVRITGFGVVNSAGCANGGVRVKLDYLGLPASSDCNNNGLLDSCEIGTGAVPDCNGNGLPDSCDIASGYSADCNGNGKPDSCDIASGASSDLDHNGKPDECAGEYIVGGTGYSTVQAAVVAAPAGATVLVGPGVRHELTYIGKRITLRSIAGAAATVIDGTGMTDSLVTFTTFPGGGTAVLDGFTFRNGTVGTEWNVPSGGAVSVIQASVAIRNCVFVDNHSELGGAIYVAQSSPTIENCTFADNTASAGGGAIAFDVASGWTVTGCTFTGNASAGTGGAVQANSSSGAFAACSMGSNHAATYGGAIAWDSSLAGTLSVSGSTIELNSAAAGGALAVVGGTRSFAVSNSRICRNTPNNFSGGVTDAGGNTFSTDCNGNGVCDADEIASGGALDCNGNGVLDWCDISSGFSLDCNGNQIPDSCDIASGYSHDVDGNGVPDECKPDCDHDGLPDAWELAQGLDADCNHNNTIDRCEIAAAPALDCNGNVVLDSCELAANPALDCNGNGKLDSCDIAAAPALDCDHNGKIDSCEMLANPSLDCNHNGRLDACDISAAPGLDKNANGHLDTCELARGDLNLDGVVNAADLGILLNLWGLVNPPLGDLNRDGVVSAADLGLMLNAWGSTP